MFGIQISAAEVLAALQSIESAIAGPAVGRGLLNGGGIVADKGRDIVAVDTGATRDSITVHTISPNEVMVTANTPYAAELEYSQPYLRPALAQTQHWVIGAVVESIQEELR